MSRTRELREGLLLSTFCPGRGLGVTARLVLVVDTGTNVRDEVVIESRGPTRPEAVANLLQEFMRIGVDIAEEVHDTREVER